MTTRIEEQQLDLNTLARLAKSGPFVVTRNGTPAYVVHPATAEWLEALEAEENLPGDMSLEEYAGLFGITLDTEKYLRESPDDAPYTAPPADEGV